MTAICNCMNPQSIYAHLTLTHYKIEMYFHGNSKYKIVDIKYIQKIKKE